MTSSTSRMTRTSAPTANERLWCAGPRASRNSTSILPPASATWSSTPWPASSCSSSAAYRGAARPSRSAPSNFACCVPIGGASTACTSHRSVARPRPRDSRALRRSRVLGAVGGGAGRRRLAAPGLCTLQFLAPGDCLPRRADAAVAAAHATARGGPGHVLWGGLLRCRHLVAVHLDPRPRARARVAEPDAGATGRRLHGLLLRPAGLVYGAPRRAGPGRAALERGLAAGARGVDGAPRCAGGGGHRPGCDTAG